MTLSTLDIAALQRRTLAVLFLGTIGARAAGTLTFTVASLAVLDMLDGTKFAGLPTMAVTIGTAMSAKLLSTFMAGRGRRPGLALGFSIASSGLVLAAVGVQKASLTIFLVGLTLFGVGQGSANLARFAAADLALPMNRGKAISLIIFASTIGAVGGPLLIAPAERLASGFKNGEVIGPYAAGALCMLVAAGIIQAALRPDPLTVAAKLERQDGGVEGPVSRPSTSFAESFRAIRRNSTASLALAAMVIAQMVMVMVMVMTPAHMEAHDHGQSVVGWVISIHTAGMYMFAPLAGWASDRFGRVRTIMQGGAVLSIATIVTALAGEAPRALLFPGLFLLGLGWSLTMVSASALVTESVPEDERVAVQGSADLVTSAVSGIGALGAGFIFNSAGYHILSIGNTVVAGCLVTACLVHLQLRRSQ